jgi:branched-chain amino acid transport system permease protein
MRSRRVYIVGLLLVLALLPFGVNRYHLSILILAGLHAIMSTGFNLLVGYTGQLSFGHNAFVGLGAYASAVLTTRLGWPPLPAIVAGLGLSLAIALLVGVATLRLRGHSLAMATAGIGVIGYVLFSELEITRGFIGIGNIPPLALGPWSVSSDRGYYYVICILTFAGLWVCDRLVSSRVGRALAAVRDDEHAARAAGIDPARYKLRVFVLSALYASLAGSLYAHWVAYVSPEPFGLDLAILLIVILYVGGIGTLWGPPVGALIVTVLAEVLRASKGFNQLIFGVLLVVILVFAPRGLVGLGRSFRARRAPPV